MIRILSLGFAAAFALATPVSAAVSVYFTQADFFAGAPAATLLEDFEGVTGAQLDTPLPQLALSSGVYKGLAGVPNPNVYVASPGYNNFGAGNNPTTSKILTANGDEFFDVTLATPTEALGMNFYLNQYGAAVVYFYDQNNAYIDGIAWYYGFINPFEFGGISVTGGRKIARFTFESTDGGIANTGIDNLYSVRSAVPEASVWMMLIFGFGVTGAMLRRRRKAQQAFTA
jgi:hypothetical protein